MHHNIVDNIVYETHHNIVDNIVYEVHHNIVDNIVYETHHNIVDNTGKCPADICQEETLYPCLGNTKNTVF